MAKLARSGKQKKRKLSQHDHNGSRTGVLNYLFYFILFYFFAGNEGPEDSSKISEGHMNAPLPCVLLCILKLTKDQRMISRPYLAHGPLIENA